MAKNDKRERMEAAGIPDSRPFIDPAAAEEENPLLNLHMGGVSIREMAAVMGPLWLAAINFHQTDEAIAERNAGKVDARATIVQDEFSKAVERRGDFLATELEPWEAPDPMRELKDAHVRPGFRARYLSPKVCDKNAHGMRGWQPVVTPKGDPVKLGGMILAEMPEERAQRRDQHYRKLAAQQLQRQQESDEVEHARMVRDSGGGMAPLRSNQSVTGGFGVGSAAGGGDIEGTPTATIGLRTVRGNQREL